MLLNLPTRLDQALPSLLQSIPQLQYQAIKKSHPCQPVLPTHRQSSSRLLLDPQLAQARTHIVMQPTVQAATHHHLNPPVLIPIASPNVQKHFQILTALTLPRAAAWTKLQHRFPLQPVASNPLRPPVTAAAPAP